MVVVLSWTEVYNVIDHVSVILSVPLAVTGFWIAIAQIRKTRAVAEAARDMAAIARTEASRAGILVLLPQLQRVEEQIDQAVDKGSVDLVMAWANTWRWQASQLSGHLKIVTSEDGKLPQLLQSSVLTAAAAKKTLVGNDLADLHRATKRMRDAISAVTSELGALAVHYAALPERDSI
jgi:hypothetical protein